MLRGQELNLACEIMQVLSPITESIGLYHHPAAAGASRVVSTEFRLGGFPRYYPRGVSPI